jgi:nitrite reductase/ring-hydroxylating ferredoxin subunit
MTSSEADKITLCALADIPDPGSKSVVLEHCAPALELFVVRNNGAVYVYENSCPHTGVPLDWMPDQFLDLDKSHIQCATHGALFRIDDGYCIAGPCSGDRLRALPARIEQGNVVLLMGCPPREAEY